jgi:hypothetical protein
LEHLALKPSADRLRQCGRAELLRKAAVLTAASQQQGMRPRRLQMPANHMPEKPTAYTTPVLPAKAQPER